MIRPSHEGQPNCKKTSTKQDIASAKTTRILDVCSKLRKAGKLTKLTAKTAYTSDPTS